jgi:hypothetical protein
MTSSLTSINRRTTGTVRQKRKSPKLADFKRMERFVQEVLEERRDGTFAWPAGLASDNTIVANINNRGVPPPLFYDSSSKEPDEKSFVMCAAESGWPHGKTAACLGRSEQSVRITLCQGGGTAAGRKRTARRERRTAQTGPSRASSSSSVAGPSQQRSDEYHDVQQPSRQLLLEPSSSSSVAGPSQGRSDEGPAVQQPSGPLFLEPATQTTLDAQVAATRRSDPVSFRGASSGQAAVMSGLDALVAAVGIRGAESERLPPLAPATVRGTDPVYLPALRIMGIIN